MSRPRFAWRQRSLFFYAFRKNPLSDLRGSRKKQQNCQRPLSRIFLLSALLASPHPLIFWEVKKKLAKTIFGELCKGLEGNWEGRESLDR